MGDEMKAILVNARAGRGKIMKDWKEREQEIRRALALPESEVQVAFTTEEDHGAGIARKLALAGAREIVVVGGDGTLSEVFGGLMADDLATARRDLVISLMPAGRGNDFFRATIGGLNLGEGMRWQRALANLRRGTPRAIDLGRWGAVGHARETWMNVVSFGFPGLVVHKVMQKASDGSWTYVLRSLESFGPYRPIDFAVEVDGSVVYEGPIFSGFVLNGAYNAGGVRWSKTANPFDGVLEVFLQEPKSLAGNVVAAPRTLLAMGTGDWDGMEGMRRFTGTRVVVRRTGAAAHPAFEIDGEQPESLIALEEAGVEFAVVPGALQFRASADGI